MTLLIDDVRDTNVDVIARNASTAVLLLKNIHIDTMLLDHDLRQR